MSELPTPEGTASPPEQTEAGGDGKRVDPGRAAMDMPFLLVSNHVPVQIACFDPQTDRCLFANEAYAHAYGRSVSEIVGLAVADVIGTEAARYVGPYIQIVKRDRRPVRYQRRLDDAPGGRRIEADLVPWQDDDGTLRAVFVLVHDITRQHDAELARQLSEDRLDKFMQATTEGILFHKDGRITDVNPAFQMLLGRSLVDLVGRDVRSLMVREDVHKADAAIAAGVDARYEARLERGDGGGTVLVEIQARTMVYRDDTLRMAIVHDLSQREAVRSRLQHLAHHDALTGLPNRLAFMERLEQHLQAPRTRGDDEAGLALLFIDFDQFKRVNDSLGHLAGDALLKQLAARIVGALRATDCVGRFGGDEFMALLPGSADATRVRDIAHQVLNAVARPVEIEGRQISVTPSIGVALHPVHGDDADELIKNADAAMYQAKARGRATVHFFDRSIADSAFAALQVESELADALARGEFELHYQPKLDARDLRVTGAEALLRWRHPRRGLLAPEDFIDVAEQQRLIVGIGDWVMREAAREARRQRDAGRAIPIAVNLATAQFREPDFVDQVALLLQQVGLEGQQLELELTERMLMDDIAEVSRTLAGLRALGVRIAIDDFGTGYSSLGHLRELPIDRIKVDRGFVADLPDDPVAAGIVGAIAMLGQSLGLSVVAEGVETEAQQAFLVQAGCDELQGLGLAGPMAAPAWHAWLATRA